MSRCHPRLKSLLFAALITPATLIAIPASAANYYQDAKQYAENGQIKAAIIQLKNLLQAQPDHSEGRLLLGEIYLDSEQYAEAEKELKRAQKLGIDRQRLAPPLAEALIATQQFDEALNLLFLDWAADGPRQEHRWALIGSARLGQKQLSEAESAFYQSIERAPNDLAQLGLALVAQAHDRSDEALGYLSSISGDSREARRARLLRAELLRREKRLEGALTAYNEVLDDNADNLTARLGRATVALELEKLAIADDDIALLLKKIPNLPQVQILAALSAVSQQRYKDANTHAQMALQALPDNPQALLLSGTAYYYLNQFKEAEGQLQALHQKFPGHIVANRLLAATLLRQRKPTQALTILEPLLARGATDPVIRALAGNAYLLTGDLEAGERLLNDVIDQLPNDAALVNQLALSQALSGRSDDALSLLESKGTDPTLQSDTVRIVALMKQGEREKAAELLRERIKGQPDAMQYRLMLGLMQQQEGDFGAAKSTFQAAIDIDSKAAAPRIGLARISLQQNRYDDAEREFRQVLRDTPNHQSALLGLAAVAEQRGETSAMVDWLKKARQQHPASATPVNALVAYYLRQNQSERARTEAHNFYLQDTERADAALLYTRLLSRTGGRDQAVDILKPLMERNPGNPQIATELASTLKERGEFESALSITRDLIAASGPYTPAGILHAELLILTGEDEQAAKLLPKLWERKQLPVLARLRAALAIKQGQFDTAQSYLDRLYPAQRDAKLMQMMIQVQLAKGGPQATQRMLDEHLVNYGDDAFAQLQAANLAHQQGELGTAKKHYEALKTLQPTNPIPWNNLAWLYQQESDPRSVRYAREAHRLAPESPDIKDTLGWILLNNGQADEALPLLEQAANALPTNAEVQFHHAQALVATKRTNDARRILETLAAGKSAFRSEAKSLLKQIN